MFDRKKNIIIISWGYIFYGFLLFMIRNKTSSPEDFEFTRFDCDWHGRFRKYSCLKIYLTFYALLLKTYGKNIRFQFEWLATEYMYVCEELYNFWF